MQRYRYVIRMLKCNVGKEKKSSAYDYAVLVNAATAIPWGCLMELGKVDSRVVNTKTKPVDPEWVVKCVDYIVASARMKLQVLVHRCLVCWSCNNST